jgi:hypothetical protein
VAMVAIIALFFIARQAIAGAQCRDQLESDREGDWPRSHNKGPTARSAARDDAVVNLEALQNSCRPCEKPAL